MKTGIAPGMDSKIRPGTMPVFPLCPIGQSVKQGKQLDPG